MKLFAGEGGHSVALFGSGLIGSAIERPLRRRANWLVETRPYAWDDDVLRTVQLEAIKTAVLERSAGRGSRFDLIWAAGVSGFGAAPEVVSREVARVAELRNAAAELADRDRSLRVVFHLVSSAGGLFEGKTHVGADTEPAPLRPYGAAKLQQEQLVHTLEGAAEVLIYRPASIYGFERGARRGLFATLVANALANRTTLINGLERTLRDYVYAGDVGRYVASKVLGGPSGGTTFLLASGKPTSMFEVIALIERLLARRMYRRFEPQATNALNLSFAQSGLPADWATTPLAEGLALLNAKIQADIVRRPPGRGGLVN